MLYAWLSSSMPTSVVFWWSARWMLVGLGLMAWRRVRLDSARWSYYTRCHQAKTTANKATIIILCAAPSKSFKNQWITIEKPIMTRHWTPIKTTEKKKKKKKNIKTIEHPLKTHRKTPAPYPQHLQLKPPCHQGNVSHRESSISEPLGIKWRSLSVDGLVYFSSYP